EDKSLNHALIAALLCASRGVETPPRGGQPRIDLESFVELGDGFVDFALHQQRVAEIRIGEREVRSQREGFAIMDDRVFDLAAARENEAEIIMTFGERRVDLQRRSVLLARFV